MSKVEDEFLFQVLAYELPKPVREYKFLPYRKFRADFAWVKYNLLVEIEGGVYSGGRHTRGAGYTKDCEKYNLAALEGWTVLRFTSKMVSDGSAIRMVALFLDRAIANIGL